MRVGSILSMRGCQLFVIDVVYWVIRIANVSGLIKDEFEFGPWLRSVALKTNHKKGSSSKQRSDDYKEEHNLIFEGEKDTDGLSKH